MKMREVTLKLPECIYQLAVKLLLLYRRLRYGEAFRLIPLPKGLFAIVSPQDYDRLAAYKWLFNKKGNLCYSYRYERSKTAPKKQIRIPMHRHILAPPDDLLVDHRNHNGLDNRPSNLRIATPAENGYNKRKPDAPSSSRFKGVCWAKREAKWRAQGKLNSRQFLIGYFDNEHDAARAYDEWAKQAFGQFAELNFPPPRKGLSDKASFRLCYGDHKY
jgi:hypothetical protein